jgi:hypothetical protein
MLKLELLVSLFFYLDILMNKTIKYIDNIIPDLGIINFFIKLVLDSFVDLKNEKKEK